MKRSLLVLSLLLVFTGCSIGKQTQETTNYTFKFPNDWKVGNVSNSDQFPDVLSFVYKLDEDGNTLANVNVTSVTVVGELDTELFAEQSILEAESYPGYKSQKTQKLTVAGQKTKVHTFEATGEDGQKNIIMQTYVLDGETGYILTALMPEDADGTIKASVRNIFKSFSLVKHEEVTK